MPPPSRPAWTRRAFVGALAGATAGATAGALLPRPAAGRVAGGPPVYIFSKHLQWLAYPEMARHAAEIGFDGVELTVRPRGHVLPERVEEDLPRAVEAVRAAGLQVEMIVTAINDPDDPRTEAILRTAGALGIRYYRMGYWRYDLEKPIPPQLEEIRPRLRDLAAMNAAYRIAGDYQNHAGSAYVGAPVWDLWSLIQDLDPTWIGCQFDIRHATVEGGTSWPIDFNLIAPRIHTIIAKDFAWQHREDGWHPQNVPLGEGVVRYPAYFERLKATGFRGPVTVHYEYELGGAEHGAAHLALPEKLVTRRMEVDLLRLRQWLAEAGMA